MLSLHSVLYSVIVECPTIIGDFQMHTLAATKLVTLQVLHNLWFCRILAMIGSYMKLGYVRHSLLLRTPPPPPISPYAASRNSLLKHTIPIESYAESRHSLFKKLHCHLAIAIFARSFP